MAKEIILHGHKVAKGKAEGEAIVSQVPIEFRGRVNPVTGKITDLGSPLDGASLTDKIMVYPYGKGSTQSAWVLYDMLCRKTNPIGIVNVSAAPIDASGAIFIGIPMIDKLDGNPVELIKTGDWVEIDADKGTVKIKKA